MSSFIQHVMTNWKTSLAGFLSFVLTTLTTISGFFVASDVVTSGPSVSSIHVHTWVLVGINLATALCRVWIGMLQKDAGQTPAIPPAGGPVEMVPSHETPNDPNATPVVKP